MFSTILIATNALTMVLWQHERTQVRHLEGRMLRMRQSPHFLFNRLSDIHSHYYLLDPKKSELILDLASHTRYQLTHLNVKQVPLSIEIDHIRRSVKFFSKDLDPSTKIEFYYSNATTKELHILPCLFDDVLYNCFKFTKKKNGYVFCNITVDYQQRLYLYCVNNYENHKSHSTQSGLEILTKLLNIYYRHRHSIEINQDEQSYQIGVTLKLN